jgi:spore germination protein YaaH
MENENARPWSHTVRVHVPQEQKQVVSQYIKRAKLVREVRLILITKNTTEIDIVTVSSWIIDMSEAGIDKLSSNMDKKGILEAAKLGDAPGPVLEVLKR